MAPPVTNSDDPDRTESDEGSETVQVPAPSETTVNIENQLESGAPSTDEVSDLTPNTSKKSPQVENSTNIASNVAPTPLQPWEETQQRSLNIHLEPTVVCFNNWCNFFLLQLFLVNFSKQKN